MHTSLLNGSAGLHWIGESSQARSYLVLDRQSSCSTTQEVLHAQAPLWATPIQLNTAAGVRSSCCTRVPATRGPRSTLSSPVVVMQQQSHAHLTHLAGGYAVWQPAGTPIGSVAQLVAIPANWKLTSCPNASTAPHEHQPVQQQHVLLTMGTAPANAAASSCWPASKQGPGPGRLMQHLSNTVAAEAAGRPYPGSSYRYLDRSGSPGSLSNASSPPGSQHLPCLSAASQQLARWVAIASLHLSGRSLLTKKEEACRYLARWLSTRMCWCHVATRGHT